MRKMKMRNVYGSRVVLRVPYPRARFGGSCTCLWAAHCEGSVTEATLGQLPESWSRAAVEPKAARSHQTEAETNGMTTQFT